MDDERLKDFQEYMIRWEKKKKKFGFILPTHHILVFNNKSEVTYFINAVLFNAVYYKSEPDHNISIKHFNEEFYQLEILFGIELNFMTSDADTGDDYDTTGLEKFDEPTQYYDFVKLEPRSILDDYSWSWENDIEYPIMTIVGFNDDGFRDFNFVNLEEVMNHKHIEDEDD